MRVQSLRPRDIGSSHLNRTLVEAELFVGVGAVYGGVMLMADAWHLPVSDLSPLPLGTWVLPGIALVALVAGPMLSAAVLLLVHHRRAADASTAAGVVLIGWVLVQLAVIGPRMILQAVMLFLGVFIATLGWRLRRTWNER